MINENLIESDEKPDLMDMIVPVKLGDGSPFLIKFYGAMHAEVM